MFHTGDSPPAFARIHNVVFLDSKLMGSKKPNSKRNRKPET